MKDYTKKLEQMLIKKAFGFKVREVVEEFAVNDTMQLKLVKRKVSVKYIPPDISAARAYAENYLIKENVSTMTDSQLLEEKQRLLNVLQQINEEKEEVNVTSSQVQE